MDTTFGGGRPSTIADIAFGQRRDPLAAFQHARYLRQVALGEMIARAVATATRAVTAWYGRQALRRQLMDLSDHMLADIGIRRDQIPAIVAGTLRREATELERAVQRADVAFIGDKTRAVQTSDHVSKPLAA